MKIKYTYEAIANIEEIFVYISSDNVSSAYKVKNSLKGAIEKLREFPNSGILSKDKALSRKGYRYLIVGDYLIFYVILKSYIEIRYVVHGAMNYKKLIK